GGRGGGEWDERPPRRGEARVQATREGANHSARARGGAAGAAPRRDAPIRIPHAWRARPPREPRLRPSRVAVVVLIARERPARRWSRRLTSPAVADRVAEQLLGSIQQLLGLSTVELLAAEDRIVQRLLDLLDQRVARGREVIDEGEPAGIRRVVAIDGLCRLGQGFE